MLRISLLPGGVAGISLGGPNGHSAANGTLVLQAPLVLVGAGHSVRGMCVLPLVEGSVVAVWCSVSIMIN